ncbi:hypothetical protein PAPYR_5663 [Paratrimastix pyriformis]|uniref:Uncharacterized protein n=1 Tax=Paratrimastix pyriformis TaxID=342808 RepID=A0ABQ8UJ97_9EUKA|nr:hypothetical protein PAPYR_5663 [Paratrimastix pyriformis]
MSTAPPAWRRNALTHKERFVDAYSFPLTPDEHLEIIQDESTVTCVWDAAIVFSRFLLRHPELLPARAGRPCRVLELGAGTGLAGLVSAWMGCQAILTELGDVLPVLRRNVGRFEEQFPGRRGLARPAPTGGAPTCTGTARGALRRGGCWGLEITTAMSQGGFDVVIGTDIVYEVQHFPHLIRALLDVSDPRANPRTVIYLCYERRWKGPRGAVVPGGGAGPLPGGGAPGRDAGPGVPVRPYPHHPPDPPPGRC